MCIFQYAGYSTKAGSGTHYAAGGAVSVNNPKVSPGQLSGSVLSIEGGPPEQFSTIRVGWIVRLYDHIYEKNVQFNSKMKNQ